MIPLKDTIPSRRIPVATFLLIIACTVIFVCQHKRFSHPFTNNNKKRSSYSNIEHLSAWELASSYQ